MEDIFCRRIKYRDKLVIISTSNGTIDQWTFEKFTEIAKELWRVTKQGGVIVWIVADAVVKGSETGSSFRHALFFKELGFNLHDTMIWNKRTSFIYDVTRYYASFEYMFILSKGKPKTVNLIKDKPNKTPGKAVCYSNRKADGSTSITHGHTHNKVAGEYGIRYNVWDIYPVQSSKENRSSSSVS